MKKYIYILIILFIKVSLIFAQRDNPDENYGSPALIPPSPNAAGLGRYGDYPVATYTGVTPINIPFFEIKTKRITVPISISYHTSGIRVDDVASNIGLGWSMNAGGCISISVQSASDGKQHKGFLTSFMSMDDLLKNPERLPALAIDSYVWGNIDRMSDIYTYNFGEYSGQFGNEHTPLVVSQRKNIVNLADNGLRILGQYKEGYQNAVIDGYTIVTPDGISYQFNKPTKAYFENSYTDVFESAWYLTEIKDLTNGETIKFHYKQATPMTTYSLPQGITKYDSKGSGKGCLPEYTIASFKTTSFNTEEVELYEIEFPLGKIQFDIVSDRKDVKKERVKKIELYAINDQKPIKKIELFHSYFGSKKISAISQDLRLRLDSLVINGIQKYQFNYNTEELPSQLPPPGSATTGVSSYFAQDEWGYYNGASANRTLIKYSGGGFPLPDRPSADRRPNERYMKACSLEEIIYPTGGKTRFEYESNKPYEGDYPYGGLRIKKITNFEDKEGSKPTKKIIYEYEGGRFPPTYKYYTGWGSKGYINLEQERRYCGENALDVDATYDVTYFSSTPLVSNRFLNGAVMLYNLVRERVVDEINQEELVTEYTYRIDEQTYDFRRFDPGLLVPSSYYSIPPKHTEYAKIQSFRSGQLLKQRSLKYINGELKPIHETINIWNEFNVKDHIIGIVVDETWFNPQGSLLTGGRSVMFFDVIAETGSIRLTKQITNNYTYSNNAPIILSDTINYSYDQTIYSIKKEHITSTGDVFTTDYRRPGDYKGRIFPSDTGVDLREIEAGINALRFIGWITPIIEEATSIKKKGSNTSLYMSSKLSLYKQSKYSFSSVFFNKMLSMRLDKPIENYTLSYFRRSQDDTPIFEYQKALFEDEFIIEEHDKFGNIISLKKRDGNTIIFLWSYLGQYPIAEIKNATYNEVVTALQKQSKTVDGLSAMVTPIWDTTKFRTDLPNALVTTYTYKPLVGMLTATDPSLRITSYEYDSFNRLYRIKDHEGKIVEEYTYNYSNK